MSVESRELPAEPNPPTFRRVELVLYPLLAIGGLAVMRRLEKRSKRR